MKNTNSLYEEHAHIYYHLANDRQFDIETLEISKLSPDKSGSFVELFAGPAYHSLEAESLGIFNDVIAIDSSDRMKNISSVYGYNSTYIVNDCTKALEELLNISVAIIPRFSICLIDPQSVDLLFNALSKSMMKDGIIAIELHNNIDIEQNLENISIKERNFFVGKEKFTCKWPKSILSTNNELGVNNLSIEVEIRSTDTHITSISNEYLYDIKFVEEKLETIGFILDKTSDIKTPSGTFNVFRNKESLFNDKESVTYMDNMVSRSLSEIFTLDNDSAKTHISRSGLDIEKHHTTLTSHVYNLL